MFPRSVLGPLLMGVCGRQPLGLTPQPSQSSLLLLDSEITQQSWLWTYCVLGTVSAMGIDPLPDLRADISQKVGIVKSGVLGVVSGKLAGLGEMGNFLEEVMMGLRLEGWPGASEYRSLRGQSA